MRDYTHPHAPIHVLDDSSALRESKMQRSLHRPLIFTQAVQGDVNVPIRCSGAEAVDMFGLETFDMFSSIYHNEQFFMENAFFPHHSAWVVRLADENAKKSSVVVELHVTPTDVAQYERDEFGGIVKAENGKPIPLLDDTNQVIKEPGYKFKYVSRPLADGERLGHIKPSTVKIGETETTIYPIIDAQCTSVGVRGDSSGFRLYFDPIMQDESLLTDKKALSYVFQAITVAENSSISDSLRDIYGAVGINFMAKPNQEDTRVQMRLSFDDKVDTNYYDSFTKKSTLPYEVNLYSETFRIVGELVAAVELNDVHIDGPWTVDILSATNIEGYPYAHVEIERDGDVTVLADGFDIFLSGGDDGDTSREAFEDRIRTYLKGSVYPEIIDGLRYPFTHIYDIGYTYETKVAILLFMAKRDDFRPSISTQDVTMEANLREEDMSLGSALRAKALLTPESVIYGTPCCRAEVYCHAGKSTNPQYKTLLPLTFWAACRRAETLGGQVMRRTLGGQPVSVVDMIQKLNYTEYDPKIKQLKFDSGLNYLQYADEEKIFFPDIRAVYTNTTSVLAGASYVDALIELKYICRRVWAEYTGTDGEKPESMWQKVSNAISTEAYRTFGTLYSCEVWVDQTDAMMKVGDEIRVTIDLWGTGVFRKMTTFIHAKRRNFSKATVLN